MYVSVRQLRNKRPPNKGWFSVLGLGFTWRFDVTQSQPILDLHILTLRYYNTKNKKTPIKVLVCSVLQVKSETTDYNYINVIIYSLKLAHLESWRPNDRPELHYTLSILDCQHFCEAFHGDKPCSFINITPNSKESYSLCMSKPNWVILSSW